MPSPVESRWRALHRFARERHRLAHARRRLTQGLGHALRHSLKGRLVALFLLLALAMAAIFLGGLQRALSVGWRDAARPLIADYVERIVTDIGTPPSIARAQALTQRLPISVRISGPQVNWHSQDDAVEDRYYRGDSEDDRLDGSRSWRRNESRLLERMTADGHTIRLGLSLQNWHDRPRLVGLTTLALLLALTGLAFAYVRRLLRPLDDIRDGARRFGAGDFTTPIPLRRADELGQLATDVNTMANGLHQMLEAKRALLLSISHELRSPLTRARLNAELLPESTEVQAQRMALLRDLGEMRDLISDLLESERLGAGHAALHTEPTDLAQLVCELVAQWPGTHASADTGGETGAAPPVRLELAADLPLLALDRTRMRLLLRNLIGNALRHGSQADGTPQLPLVQLDWQPVVAGATTAAAGKSIVLRVRDFGPGVDPQVLDQLGQAFYRPDSARTRAAGGVGLGLHLCRLVALAHGARFQLRNAEPGLEATVEIPAPV